MEGPTKQLIAEQIACVCAHLAGDLDAVSNSNMAREAAKAAREVVMSVTTPTERDKILVAYEGHPDPVMKKAVYMVMFEGLEL